MKKFFSKFLKDTRGVVMMEYIILGCFAVALTVVAVLALGRVYMNGLYTMGWATLGATEAAVAANNAAEIDLNASAVEAGTYAYDLANAQTKSPAAPISFQIYAPTK